MKFIRELLEEFKTDAEDETFVDSPHYRLAVELAKQHKAELPDIQSPRTYTWITGNFQRQRLRQKPLSYVTVSDTTIPETQRNILFFREFGLKNGIVEPDGKGVKLTPMGNEFRQFTSQAVNQDKDLTQAVSGSHLHKEYYANKEFEDENKEWMKNLSPEELGYTQVLRDLEISDITLIAYIAKLQKSGDRYLDRVSDRGSNPEQIDRLQRIGFLNNDSTIALPFYRKFVSFFDSIEPARLWGIKPELKRDAIDTVRPIVTIRNRLVNTIHPNSERGRTGPGSRVWDSLIRMSEEAYQSYKTALKTKKAKKIDIMVANSWKKTLPEELIPVLNALVSRSETKADLIDKLDRMMHNRENHKSTARGTEKAAGRTEMTRRLFPKL